MPTDRPRPTADSVTLLRWQQERSIAWARLLVAITIVLLFGVLGRVVQLKIAPDPRLASAVDTGLSTRKEPARRGDLLDRRGRVIAATRRGYRLFVDPQEVEDFQTIAVDIAMLIGSDPIPIDQLLMTRSDRRFVVVNQLLEDWQVEAIRGSNLRGLGLESRSVRHYPNGDLGAAIVGTVGFEHSGLSGMEHRYDARLRAHPGSLTYLRDAGRNALWIEPDDYEPGADGGDVRLSIDLVIQDLAERRLAIAVDEFNAGGGRIVVLDCQSGEILALHDQLNPRAGWEEFTTDPSRAIHPALGRNRCVTDPYEPGSTFKPFVWAVATQMGLATEDEVLATPEHTGLRMSYGRLIRDSHYYPDATWRTVLIKSINTGMAMVAERMSHRDMQAAISRFGFGEKTGCGPPGESAGIVTSAKAWTNYSQSSVSFGHEICVTPVQMVRGFSAFARDGTIPALRLTAAADGDPRNRIMRRAIPATIAMKTRRVMRDVMTDGTGRNARSEQYSMFAKSGTAQLPRKEGGYFEDRYVSSFIAGAPFEEPRIVVLCVIDDPDRDKGHWGGAIAGPVVRDIIDGTLEYLGVAADLPNEYDKLDELDEQQVAISR